MTMSCRLARAAAALLLLVAGMLAATAPAAGQTRGGPRPVPATGTEFFRGLFRYHKIAPVVPSEISPRAHLRDTIVVVLGSPGPGTWNPVPYTVRALRDGGAVLIAVEDQDSLTRYFPERSVIDVTGEVVASKRPTADTNYAGDRDCPFVVPAPPQFRIDFANRKINWDDSPHWQLFAGLDRVAVNRSGAIRAVTRNRYTDSVVAKFPPGCVAGGRDLPADRVFALAGSGKGDDTFRCLVLADPSVFSTQMLQASIPAGPHDRGRVPTENLLFADRVVQFLRGPNDRSRCLFIENGVPQTSFDDVNIAALQSPSMPIPPPPDPLNPELQRKLTDSVNRGIADWQDSDGPNRIVAGQAPEYTRFVWAVQFLTAVAAVLTLIALVRRAWRGRHEPDVPPVPTDTGRVAASGPPGSLARRREEILHAGDYTEVVREYLRELFAARGMTAPVPGRGSDLHDIEVRGPGATTLREYLRILWGVAYGPRPRPVTYSRWKELEPMIDAVRRAADEDRWRFAKTGGGA
jgi:hypothetical protein